MTGNWIEEIRGRLVRSWPERAIVRERRESGSVLRPAGVLVPLYARDGQLFTIFTKRTELVEHHKGQISFPGGTAKASDANLWATATREAEEETGIPSGRVLLLGALPKAVTVTDFEISPFVGAVPYPIELRKHAGEVAEILEIPISYLLDPQVAEERPVEWKGKEIRTLVYHYRGHAIWGATAHVLSDLLEVLRGEPPPA